MKMSELIYNVFHYLADSSLKKDTSVLRTTASITSVPNADNAIDLFYDIYKTRLKDLEESQRGVSGLLKLCQGLGLGWR